MDRILVIDDEPGILELTSQVLKRSGYFVETAPNGREGLQCLKSEKFDLVVTDMHMPDLNGDQIIHHIRGSERSFIPVVGISGTPWRLVGAGCDAVLSKPFALQTLVETIEGLLKRHLATASVSCSVSIPLRTQAV